MFFSIRAFRDRDGLRDLKNQTHMGNRETVMTSLSTGFVEFPLTQRTSISPVVYYQSGVSRFKHYSEGKSLDDNSVGFSLTSSTRRGNTERGVTVTSDSRFIDSRLHEDSWTNNDTRISCLWRWTDNRFRYVLRGGILGSSRYGTGGIGESKLVYQMTPSIEFSVRGAVTDEVPDIGLEFYPALEFSDTTITTELDMYRIMEFESGLRLNSRILSCGLYAFRSRGKHPLFDPENILSMMAEKETYSGIRFFMTAHEDDRYHTEVTIHYTDSSNSRNIWPNPGFEMVSYSQIYRKFYRKKLDSTLFGSMRVSNWSDGPVNPDGTAFFLDGGISIRVMTLTVFYMVENITGEDMVWFDILGWQGRNSMWGIQWKLEN